MKVKLRGAVPAEPKGAPERGPGAICANEKCNRVLGEDSDPRSRYCGVDCRREQTARNDRRRNRRNRNSQLTEQRECKYSQCDNLFDGDIHGNQLYCSPECREMSRKERMSQRNAMLAKRKRAERAAKRDKKEQEQASREQKRIEAKQKAGESLVDEAYKRLKAEREQRIEVICSGLGGDNCDYLKRSLDEAHLPCENCIVRSKVNRFDSYYEEEEQDAA